MFEHAGIWLPDGETHLTGMLDAFPTDPDDGRGTYQIRKLEAAMAHVPAGRRRVAVDIGAHVGLWTVQLMKRFETVHCFEPLARHRECWERNVRGTIDGTRPWRTAMHAYALGESPGMCSFALDPASSGDTHVADAGGMLPVERRTLDSFGLDRVDFVKIDTEGYELPICRGGAETLARCRPVMVVEQKPGKARRYGLGDCDAISWLRDLGAEIRDEISGDFIMTWPAAGDAAGAGTAAA